uniref:Putative secreted protein n=1 Tax=Anopheles darlingi TaxID=43151 RepID=A0A2M4D8A3_ANODA
MLLMMVIAIVVHLQPADADTNDEQKDEHHDPTNDTDDERIIVRARHLFQRWHRGRSNLGFGTLRSTGGGRRWRHAPDDIVFRRRSGHLYLGGVIIEADRRCRPASGCRSDRCGTGTG